MNALRSKQGAIKEGSQKQDIVYRSEPCRLTTYQASGVKRADGCTTGAGWPSVEQTVKRRGQAIGADLISVAGRSRWTVPNTY
jgi:hypothetical protein